MLVVGDLLSASGIVVAVVRLDERVIRQGSLIAVFLKLVECAEQLRLVLQQVRDLHGRTGRVVVVDLGCALRRRANQPAVNAFERFIHIKRIQIHPPERCPIMRKRSIADRRPWNRSKPPVEHSKFQRQAGQDRQLLLREVIHDLRRMLDVHLLIEVTLHEALHVWCPACAIVPAKNLQVHGRKVVIGIRIKLTLKFRQRLRFDQRASRIRVTELVGNAINRGIIRL